MISCRFLGRLGNSMFQVAATLALARKYGYDWGVPHDSGTSDSSIHRLYPNLPRCNNHGVSYHEHPRGVCPIHRTLYDFCHFNYHPIPDLGPNVTISGFFQSYKYFEKSEEEIKNLFALPQLAESEQYVSVHVRRGDYVEHAQSFPPVDADYLRQAMDHFTGHKFLIFSDDIPWCQAILGDGHSYTVTGDPRNPALMASCEHHIICNSTYSWWWAYLGHNPDRKVISPSCERGNWFGFDSGVKMDVIDLLPVEWIQIKFR